MFDNYDNFGQYGSESAKKKNNEKESGFKVQGLAVNISKQNFSTTIDNIAFQFIKNCIYFHLAVFNRWLIFILYTAKV